MSLPSPVPAFWEYSDEPSDASLLSSFLVPSPPDEIEASTAAASPLDYPVVLSNSKRGLVELPPPTGSSQTSGGGRFAMMKRDAAEAFTPSHTQYITIYVIEFYFVFMLLGWNLAYVRSALFPFKLLTVGFHESCHALTGTLTGAKVDSIMLDPNQGGATRMSGGWAFISLPAGYIGSSTIGAALIFAGFDEKASKIACFPVLFFILVLAFWGRKDWFTLVNISFPLGLMVLFYVIEHAAFLRFYILFIGVMNCMYALWDVLDDLVFHKIEASDCYQFWRLYPWIPAQAWGAIWFLFGFSSLLAGVLGGLVAFKQNFEQQQATGQGFIPT